MEREDSLGAMQRAASGRDSIGTKKGTSPLKIGYIRISTTDQNTARQEFLMEQLGVDEVYIDRMSGKNTNRPQLQKMMAYVRRGDTVIVESISRFARNTRDLLELVEQLTAKGVEFISKKGGHRHRHTRWQVHADRVRCCGGAGAGVHPSAPTGGRRHCQGQRRI